MGSIETSPGTLVENPLEQRWRLAAEPTAWVASATATGEAHLIPLSYYWDGTSLLFSTAERSRTMRDLKRTGRTRAALENTGDVVILDGMIEIVDPAAGSRAIDAFAAHHGWDPRKESTPFTFFRLFPDRVQAWSGPSDISTRDVMRDGRWIDDEVVSAT